MRLSHSSTNWKMLASYSFWNRVNMVSFGLAALAVRYSVLSRSVCDFGQAPRSIFCMSRRSHKRHPLQHSQVPAPNKRNKSATSITGAIKVRRVHVMIPRCDSGRAGPDEDIGDARQPSVKLTESKSTGVIAHDAMETHCVREECMGTRPTQEVPTNLLICPMKVRVCSTHRFWAHHLLRRINDQRQLPAETAQQPRQATTRLSLLDVWPMAGCHNGSRNDYKPPRASSAFPQVGPCCPIVSLFCSRGEDISPRWMRIAAVTATERG